MTNIKFFLQTEQAKADAVLLACATEVRTQRGHNPQVLVCSQLELGPTFTAFIHFGQIGFVFKLLAE